MDGCDVRAPQRLCAEEELAKGGYRQDYKQRYRREMAVPSNMLVETSKEFQF